MFARLTGTLVVKFAKPSETFDLALGRKSNLADVKKKL